MYRYHDDTDLNLTDGGQFRDSQRSRYSDTAVPVRTGEIVTPNNSLRNKDVARSAGPGADPGDLGDQPPVLFNKYALDRDESMRGMIADQCNC